ncbi:MAG: cryptochrome/photolyase family protein [Flavobacteriaceae bacterium]
MNRLTLFWFRRDLRVEDNVGLYHALLTSEKVLPIFIFDDNILSKLPKKDARLEFIYHALGEINDAMKRNRCRLGLYRGDPKAILQNITDEFLVDRVVTNNDYEPYATKRDAEIAALLKEKNIAFETFKDQVIFEKKEITKADNSPYVVYTPYSKKWLEAFQETDIKNHPSETLLHKCIDHPLPWLTLEELGFKKTDQSNPKYSFTTQIIDQYEATRNYPAIDQTSRLGVHLRFGTVSIRKLVIAAAKRPNLTFLKELIWREFFMQILWHFPHTVNQSFKPQYDRILWRNNPEEFEKWQKGQTGYPLVDAGMRQLNKTGFMHNRVRMLVGSFLCKHLLIDWRWGEAYFAEKLLDYEQSSNIGNWQWVAGCGVDAAPYFRIFNPTEQIKKFDSKHQYIKKWVPEYQELNYPQPIVEHKASRERCLITYKSALNDA